MDTKKRLHLRTELRVELCNLRRERCFHSLAEYLPELSQRQIAAIIANAEKLQAAKTAQSGPSLDDSGAR